MSWFPDSGQTPAIDGAHSRRRDALSEGHIARPPSRSRLAWFVGGGFIVATLVVVLFILPVEYRYDPTGFGRAVGLDALGNATAFVEAPAPAAAPGAAPAEPSKFYETGYRTDTINIPLPGNDGDLEYKVKMKAGDVMVYSWDVPGVSNPEWFYSEFHGHTEPSPGQVGVVTFYRKATGSKAEGWLKAPFEGIHGWYLQNQGTEPVTVHLRIAGFYELIPGQLDKLTE
jgi:hypothetical protein